MTTKLLGILTLTAILGIAPTITSDSFASPTCNGQIPTILIDDPDTQKHTVIMGTDNDDVIHVQYSTITHLVIMAGEGNDSICIHSGANLIFAGPGNDTVITTSGANVIYGGSGSDNIQSDGGANIAFGEKGNDTIDLQGGHEPSYAIGGTGKDTIYIGSSKNGSFADGGDHNDTIYSSGTTKILGGNGNDKIYATNGHNKIHGGGGDDIIDAGKKTDIVDGGYGYDQCTHYVDIDSTYETKYPDKIDCEQITTIDY